MPFGPWIAKVVEADLHPSMNPVAKEIPWDHGNIEGYAFKEDKRNRVNIFAWMSQEQFNILTGRPESAGEVGRLVSEWIKEIQHQTLMDMRETAI